MTWRVLGSLACVVAVALAVSCSSDDDRSTPDETAAGAAGEAPTTSGGSSSLPQAGGGGKASGGSAGAAAGTASSSADAGGAGATGGAAVGGAAGESASGGAPDGTGGEPNAPSGAVSPTCGTGKYDAGTPGCVACPAPPSTNEAVAIDCSDYAASEHDGNGDLLLDLGVLAVHEPFVGQVEIRWLAEDIEGSATVDWEYSALLHHFVFHLPVEARYAGEFTLASWSFSDSCGFSFSATSFHVYWDGVESWQCGEPT
ncbi:MAG TPA: hypothetical protein VEQ59_20615 [Polyangiaceae bacterium]|nr:hypothetical protein [Polyangiaceae bacterium]